MSSVLPAPPPPNQDTASNPGALTTFLYLLWSYVISIASGGSTGVFGPPGVTTSFEAMVPDTSRSFDYIDLDELSLHGITVDSTSTELNQLHTSGIQRYSLASLQSYAHAIHTASITIGIETANIIRATVQFYGADGNILTTPVSCQAYLSDNVDGQLVTATAPNGGVVTASVGMVYNFATDGSFSQLFTDDNGQVNMDIAESATGTWFLCLIMPWGKIQVSSAITFI